MAFSGFPGFGSMFMSPPSGFGIVSGGAILQPRLKTGHSDQEDEIPIVYDTKIGRLRIPRQTNPPAPTSEVIRDARIGRLDRQFRLGKIVRASEFIGDVIPSTAVLTISKIYDYQTRPLSVHDKVKPEQKTIRNLFYISLREDELPSYHFWTGPGDPDPVERQDVDWSKEFKRHQPSSSTAARLVELERERHLRAQATQLQDSQDEDSYEDEDSGDDGSGPESGDSDPPAWPYDKAIMTVMQDAVWQGKLKASQAPGLPDAQTITVFPKSPEDVQAFVQRFEENDEREREIGRKEKEIDVREKAIKQKEKQKIGGDSASTPSIKVKTAKIRPKGRHALLQFRKGGMYLTEFNNRAFVEMTRRLVDNEEKQPPQGKDPRMYIDIRQPGLTSEYQVGSSAALTRLFGGNVKPCLEKSGFEFQVRSLSMAGESFFDKSRYDPTAIKVARVGIGYYYVYASWGEADDAADNNRSFEYALNFFFPHDHNSRLPAATLVLEIPGQGSFSIDRSADQALDANIQSIFARLTSSHSSRSAPEVFIHRSIEGFEQPESEDMGPLLSSPIVLGGRYLPRLPLFPHGFPAEDPRSKATVSAPDEKGERSTSIASMAGPGSAGRPLFCPYCDEPDDEMAEYRTKEDLRDHIDGLHYPESSLPSQPAQPAQPTQTRRQSGQRECPFEECHEFLEVDEDHPRYFLNQSHLLMHSNAAVAEAVVAEKATQKKELDRLLKNLELANKDHQRVNNIAQQYEAMISSLKDELNETQTALAEMTQTIDDRSQASQPPPRIDQQTQPMPPHTRVTRATQTEPPHAPTSRQTQTSPLPTRVTRQTQTEPPHAPTSRQTQTSPPPARITRQTQTTPTHTHAQQGTQTTPPNAPTSRQTQTTPPHTLTDHATQTLPTIAPTPQQPTAPAAAPLPQPLLPPPLLPPQPPPNPPKKLWYCDTCRKSINTLTPSKKTKHATQCSTTVASFLYLTPQEAKLERTKPNPKKDDAAATTTASGSVSRPRALREEEGVVFESRTRGEKRKRRAEEDGCGSGSGVGGKRARR